MSISLIDQCPDCGGSGYKSVSEMWPCSRCEGTGYAKIDDHERTYDLDDECPA
jgi:DnaJ-class molecular chaperone